ncbi:MAG: helix-turn-helix domain-containing protein [Eggerthellaceae bacterium]|jgi:transcriptional regulator with XRE-family HTH domain|nr:helix-turn-helix domain-containing protein [Eggerthellaceae bacterium]MDR2715663.1 helix-turn-helix domain-containing protein [Coriobacteriaceae bacterium]
MNFDSLLQQQTPFETRNALRERFRLRRKEKKLSQQELANKADVSLASLKRFEASGNISLNSLIKLSFALGYEDDFDRLFSQKHYQSIQDVISDAAH